MMAASRRRPLLAVLPLLLLTACERDLSDLQNYVAEVRARKSNKVDPLPEITPYVGYTYHPEGRKSPFELPLTERERRDAAEKAQSNAPETIAPPKRTNVKPVEGRKPGPLELMPLDSFRVVGLMTWRGEQWALLRSSEPYVYRVRVGDYIGQNHGLIQSINDQEIRVRELLPDGFGGWTERMTNIVVNERPSPLPM